MKKNILLSAMSLLGLMLLGSCDAPKPVEGGALIEQTAQLNNYVNGKSVVVSSSRVEAAMLNDVEVLNHSYGLTVSLFKPAEKDITATVQVDEDKAKSFITQSGRAYQLLPSQMIELPKGGITIQEGQIASPIFNVNVNLTEDIQMNTPYLFAVRLKDISGEGAIADAGDVAYFTIERYMETPEVNTVIRLTRGDYLSLDKQFPGDVSALTMECLVYVEKFRNASDVGEAQISTLMGVEGGTLLRFGDAGIDGNRLQAAGTEVDFTFEENKWYHIAFTSDNGMTSVYINGEELVSFYKYCSLYGGDYWYIGRSYSGGRGLQCQLAEVRVWSKARTKAEIQDSMYIVDAKSDGLLAYWKMNEVKDDKIPDITGNGYNLTQYQQTDEAQGSINIIKLDNPVDIE